MRLHVYTALLCIVLMAAAIPASAYFIEAENIPTSSDWTLYNELTNVEYDTSGGNLLIIDGDGSPGDAHTGSPGDLVFTTQAAGPLNGTATTVFRVRTTGDYPFTELGTSGVGWERNIVLSFSKPDDPTYRKQVNLAIRPDKAAITNTIGSTIYGGEILGDNTDWVTWTIVGKNYGMSCDIYRNGVEIFKDFTINGTSGLTTDSAIGTIDALSITAIVAGANRDGTGSWEFDWVAYKAGADPTWNPVPEPSSLFALGSGLAGLAGFAIRRRK